VEGSVPYGYVESVTWLPPEANVYLMRGTDKRGHALRFEGTQFMAPEKAVLAEAERIDRKS
jgi:hypothetical protein